MPLSDGSPPNSLLSFSITLPTLSESNKSSGFTEQKVDEFIAGKIPESDLYGLGDTYMFFEHNVDKDGKMVESMKKFKEKFPEIFEWL